MNKSPKHVANSPHVKKRHWIMQTKNMPPTITRNSHPRAPTAPSVSKNALANLVLYFGGDSSMPLVLFIKRNHPRCGCAGDDGTPFVSSRKVGQPCGVAPALTMMTFGRGCARWQGPRRRRCGQCGLCIVDAWGWGTRSRSGRTATPKSEGPPVSHLAGL
jgi:hypothetical protein